MMGESEKRMSWKESNTENEIKSDAEWREEWSIENNSERKKIQALSNACT